MKKISIIILFAIFFIGCSSNDYKQNSIPMSELNNIPVHFWLLDMIKIIRLFT